MLFFLQKFCRLQNFHYLCTRNQGTPENNKKIGIWCNGNTTDSGPVILGSSPSIPTTKRQANRKQVACLFSFIPLP